MITLFKNKKILITGGTGSFGNLFTSKILNQDFKELRILSRDEEKQDLMRHKYNNSKINFIIGDVRNKNIECYFKGIDYVIHTAALKQVPSCEFFPQEAYSTNTIGTSNVINSCIKNNVKRMILLSTDKAVYPINAMGLSKAMAEKILISSGRGNLNKKNFPIFNILRYGNVLCSRGSIVPKISNQIINNKEITITDLEMTRFVMSLENAFDLLCNCIKNGNQGEIFVQKAKACKIIDLATALSKIFKKKLNFRTIGVRHGEKLDEILVSKEEMLSSKEFKNYIKIIPDIRNLNYEKYFNKGEKYIKYPEAISSSSSPKLAINELIKILLKESYIKEILTR